MIQVGPTKGCTEVFTTLRWPWPPDVVIAHITRLHHNSNRLFKASPTVNTIKNQIQQWQWHQQHTTTLPQHVRLSVSAHTPTLLSIQSQPWQPNPLPTGGLSVQITPYLHPQATIKHNQRQHAHQLLIQAQQRTFNEVLWQHPNGHITEATNNNLFVWIHSNNQISLLTPHPDTHHCLPGITRHITIKQAQFLAINVTEGTVTSNTLKKNNVIGVFLTNSIQGCQPIGKLWQPDTPYPIASWPPIVHPIQKELYHRVWDYLFPQAFTRKKETLPPAPKPQI